MVFKSLILIHILMREGGTDRVLGFLASNSAMLNMSTFRDKSGHPLGTKDGISMFVQVHLAIRQIRGRTRQKHSRLRDVSGRESNHLPRNQIRFRQIETWHDSAVPNVTPWKRLIAWSWSSAKADQCVVGMLGMEISCVPFSECMRTDDWGSSFTWMRSIMR